MKTHLFYQIKYNLKGIEGHIFLFCKKVFVISYRFDENFNECYHYEDAILH